MRKSKWVIGVLVLFVCVLAAQAAFAAYPEKQITVLQGFKPGGGSDTLAQLTQPFLEKVIGQSFINQYIPGATGAITNTPMLQTNYIMNPEITYNISELEPLANVITDPGIIVVGKDSPYKTVQDFMNAAKENPGTKAETPAPG